MTGKNGMLFAAAALAAALLGACGEEPPRPEAGSNKLNLLLISIDSARQDLFGAYGNRPRFAPDVPPSPHIDRLASQGVLFENAYATTSWTLPSHFTMLTGRPELVHGVEIDYLRPNPDMPTLASILKENGYRTSGFYSGTYLEPHFGLGKGFERYEPCFGEKLLEVSRKNTLAMKRLDEIRLKSGVTRAELQAAEEERLKAGQALEDESHRDVTSDKVTEAVLAELDAAMKDDRPFFIFAHYFDPHHDYAPPKPFDTMFDPDYRGTLTSDDFMRNEAISVADNTRPGGHKQVCSDRDLQHLIALYTGELAWTDMQIGRVLERLDALGLAGRTLVILTADHGDEFFEHGAIGHRLTLFEEVTRIPLIFRLPGRLPAGKRVEGLASMVDILPTALRLLDVPAPKDLLSRGLLLLIDGKEDPAGRFVLGRIVRTFDINLRVPQADSATGMVPGKLVMVRESFREGSVKISRERYWTRPLAEVSPATLAQLQADAAKSRDEERLSWIDVVRHPGEEPPFHSTDFSDPAVRRVLEDFHRTYQALLPLRGKVQIGEGNEAFEDQLVGLGYAGGRNDGASFSSDEFILPPPGERLLK